MEHCKHLNCLVSEIWEMSLGHTFQNGEWQFEEHGEGDPTGIWEVICQDCGKTYRFGYAAAPKWAQAYIDSAIENNRGY